MSRLPSLDHLSTSGILLTLLTWGGLFGCAAKGDRAITVYGGRYFDNSLPDEILQFRPLDPLDSYLATVAYSEVLSRRDRYRWEAEGQVAQHFGDQDHLEINGLFIFRWLAFPWNEYVRTGFAIGDGLSYALETPKLEEETHLDEGGTNQLLNYFLLELTLAAPSWKRWSIIGRVHHRSGIFGLFDGVDGGSNILALGLRYEF